MSISTDMWIFAGIVFCQAITGYWAFHMSTELISAKVGFALITVLGIGLVILSGFRQEAAQQANGEKIIKGISQIETGVGSLTDKFDQYAQHPSKAAPAPTIAPSVPKQPAGRVTVTRYDLVPDQSGQEPGAMLVRVWIRNSGQGTACAPIITSKIDPSEPITRAELDRTMAAVTALAKTARPKCDNEIEAGSPEFFRPVARIGADDWKAVQAKKKELYFWCVLSYRDKNNTHWFSDYESVADGTDGVVEILRQRTYARNAKSPS